MSDNSNPRFLYALLAGLGASLIGAILMAVIGIMVGAEYSIIVTIGVGLSCFAVKHFVPDRSFGAAIIGAFLIPTTLFLYRLILTMFGYSVEGDGEFQFWFFLIGGAILGAYICYSKSED